jgi:putative transposase
VAAKQEIMLFITENSAKYGISKKKVSSITSISYRTYKRWVKSDDLCDLRKGHNNLSNSLTDSEEQQILEVCNSPEYCNLSPNQIVPMLADKNIYLASESTICRVLRKHKLLTHRRKSKQPSKKREPASHVATDSNQVWTWDITYLKTQVKGMFYYLYLIIDIYDRCITGFRVEESQCSTLASEMVKDTILKRGAESKKLVIHSDNGGPMKGSTMAMTLDRLGVITTFNRPSVSNDNSYSESLFKTLKYSLRNPLKPFKSCEEASLWAEEFIEWYNRKHLHSGIKYVTPHQRFLKQDKIILDNRKQVYELAKMKNPNRWINNNIKNWNRINAVFLNKRALQDSL